MVKTNTIILETCRQIAIDNLPAGTPLFIRKGTNIRIASQCQAAAITASAVYGLVAGMKQRRTRNSMKEGAFNKVFADLLLSYLSRQGLDSKALSSLYSVLPPVAEGLAPMVTSASFYQLCSKAVELTGDENIGLHVYQDVDWAELGILSFACRNAGTIAQALDVILRYARLYQSDAIAKTERDQDGKLIFTYCLEDDSLPANRYDNDMCFSTMVCSMRNLSGNPDWTFNEIYFTHPAPDDLSEYQAVFHCPVYFDAIQCHAVLSDDLYNLPVQGGDSRLFSILETELNRLYKEVGEEDNVLLEVQQTVAEALCRGVPSIEDIAAQLNITRRTLQRRLSEVDKTFKGVVEKTRQQLACRYLQSTDYPLVEIAFLLGYSELSAFIRAFRRWTGETPQKYRLKMHHK